LGADSAARRLGNRSIGAGGDQLLLTTSIDEGDTQQELGEVMSAVSRFEDGKDNLDRELSVRSTTRPCGE